MRWKLASGLLNSGHQLAEAVYPGMGAFDRPAASMAIRMFFAGFLAAGLDVQFIIAFAIGHQSRKDH